MNFKVWLPDATLFYFIGFRFIHTIYSHILTSMNNEHPRKLVPHWLIIRGNRLLVV